MSGKKSEVSRREELLSELAAECQSPEEFMGLLNDLKKSLLEKALDAEMAHHLGYQKHEPSGRGSGNSRNGKSKKTVQGDFGKAEIQTPRDRNGTFEPQLIGKHQRRFPGFDQKVIALYAKGMTTRDIADTMHELYDVEVSHDLISHVTESVQNDVVAWQNRPWMKSIRSCLWMDWWFQFAVRARSPSTRSTWLWPSTSKEKRNYWDCGFPKPKAPNSG